MVKEVEPVLCDKLRQLAQTLAVRRSVSIVESALVQVPAVVGWLRPVILLPASALSGLSGEQIEAILAHELAHIKRCDYLVNICQTAVEILGFYHPAVWWISAKIRTERENCCDDLAVGISGDRLCYARALATMEEIRSGQTRLAVAASGGNLIGRIQRLLGKNSAEKERTGWLASVIAIALIMALIIPVSLAMSSRAKSESEVVTQKDQKELSKFKTTLANGVTVELVGVCEYPSAGKQWWRPDGSRLNRKIITEDRSGYKSEYPGYEIAFKAYPRHYHFIIADIKNSDKRSGLNTLEPDDITVWRVHIKPRTKKTRIKAGIAAGKWKTVASHSGRGTTFGKAKRKKIIFSAANETKDGLIMTVSDNIDLKKTATRLVAIDKNGLEHTGRIQTGLEFGKMGQQTFAFSKVLLEDIKEFAFQTLPFEYVTFKNVVLKPKFKPDVQVEGEKKSNKLNTLNKEMIFEAIESEDTTRIQQYLASGSDINVRKDYYGDGIPPLELKATTPLHLAAIMDNKEIVDLLLTNGAEVNAKAEGDITPLLLTIFKKDKRIVELLLANGANVNTTVDGGITPLHFAYLEGDKEIIDLLIAGGADVTAKDENGLTPAEADIEEAINELLKNVVKFCYKIIQKPDVQDTGLLDENIISAFDELITAVREQDSEKLRKIAYGQAKMYNFTDAQKEYAVNSLQLDAKILRTYDGLENLEIFTIHEQGGRRDILSSKVTDARGVTGRLSFGIFGKDKVVLDEIGFITDKGRKLLLRPQILTSVYILSVPADMPQLKEIIPADNKTYSGTPMITPQKLEEFLKVVDTTPGAKMIAAPKMLTNDGETGEIETKDHFKLIDLKIKNTVQPDRKTVKLELDFEYKFDAGENQIRKTVSSTILALSDHAFAKVRSGVKNGQMMILLIKPKILESQQYTMTGIVDANNHKPDVQAEGQGKKPTYVLPSEVKPIEKVLSGWFEDCSKGNIEGIKKAWLPEKVSKADRDLRTMKELLSFNPGWEFSLLAVYWNQKEAMAVSKALKYGDPKAGEPMVLIWTLKRQNESWLLTDIDMFKFKVNQDFLTVI